MVAAGAGRRLQHGGIVGTITVYLFLGVCLVAMTGAVAVPRRIYEYPYVMTAVFLGFIGPQLLSISGHLDQIPPGALGSALTVATLCFFACWAGYYGVPLRGPVAAPRLRFDETRLFHGGVLLLVVGTAFSHLFFRAAVNSETDGFGRLTGLATIYYFFSGMAAPGLAIALRAALRTRTVASVGAALLGLYIPALTTVYGARRESTVLTLMIVGITTYFTLRIAPPRLLVVAAFAAATVLIPIVGKYRSYAREEGLVAFTRIDPIQAFADGVSEGTAPEVSLACYCIDSAAAAGDYRYGMGYWTEMVFRFVPAQFVGAGLKSSLMGERAYVPDNFIHTNEVPPGTTKTGLADSFEEFGYLGCGAFALLGVLFRRLWAVANAGSVAVQIVYACTLTSAMRALTHQTTDFLPAFVATLAFCAPVFFYSRIPPRRR